MLRYVRLAGLLNAAVWLGGCVFFTFAAAPAIFQPEVKRLLQEYNTGMVAQFLQERYFAFQVVCGALAAVHAGVEWAFFRPDRALKARLLLAGVCLLTLAGAFGLLPRLKSLYQAKHAAATPALREEAAAAFRGFHGASMGLNLLVVGGLAFYVASLGMTVGSPGPRVAQTRP